MEQKDLHTIIATLDSVLAPLQEYKSHEKQATLDHMSRAKVNMAISYCIHSLFFMYMKAEGINTTDHPFSEETARMKQYMRKIGDKEKELESMTENIQLEETLGLKSENSVGLKAEGSTLAEMDINSFGNEEKKRKITLTENRVKKTKL